MKLLLWSWQLWFLFGFDLFVNKNTGVLQKLFIKNENNRNAVPAWKAIAHMYTHSCRCVQRMNQVMVK